MTPDILLRRLLSISEATPYQATVTAMSGDHELSISGDVVFRLNDGRIRFDFHIDSESERDAAYRISSLNWRGKGKTQLNIPSQGFKYPIRIESLPHPGTIQSGRPMDRERLRGHVSSEFLGSDTDDLSSATLYIRDLPAGVWGVQNAAYRTAVVRDGQETPGSSHMLNSLTLQGGGWTVDLLEIPAEVRVADVASHSCSISRDDESYFTGNQISEFLEHDLGPFLCLMFGQRVMWSMVEGYSPEGVYPAIPWGMIYARPSITARAVGRNWFLISNRTVDPSQPFEAYSSLSSDRKRHFRRVIERYVGSDTIMGSLGLVEESITLSFSGLEGLTTLGHKHISMPRQVVE